MIDLMAATDAANNSGGESTVGGIAQIRQPIGQEEIFEAHQRLIRYKTGKNALEQRLITNERWYQLRQWEYLRTHDISKASQVEPSSAWLFNAIQNKHADAMDNFPEPNFRPREAGDEPEAKILSSIVPVILDECDFEGVFSALMDDKIRSGTGVYGVFWDAQALNGLGEIAIRAVDLLTIFWEPGKSDIQQSRDLFTIELVDTEQLMEQYPQLVGKLNATGGGEIAKYITDDTIDTHDKSAVIDWYYKKAVGGKTVLHYCKFVGDQVLFATENDPEYAERGLYDHGKYPFVFDPLYRVKGSPCGFGFIDVGKSAQEYIDRADQAIMENMLTNAKPRHFIRNDGSINEGEFSDLRNPLVHVDGNLGDDSIRPISPTGLGGIYYSVLEGKINELKETTGNRDISTGGTASGVTAASAIAAMQEAGSKLSRDINKGSYRAFREVATLIVELIRQFYDLPRQFRIVGEGGEDQFVSYSNAGLAPQAQQGFGGMDMGYRVPVFDIEVTAQKASPYTKMAQNELALQFYNNGFFEPNRADQSLACLAMMDFDDKDKIGSIVQRNGTMFEMIQQLQQQMLALGAMVDQAHGGSEITQGLMAQFGGMAPGGMAPAGEAPSAAAQDALGGDSEKAGESSITRKARQQAAEGAAPR